MTEPRTGAPDTAAGPSHDDDADAALERAIADACLGANAGAAMSADLRGFLEGHGVAAEDVEDILARPEVLRGRIAVYRSLVRNGMGSVVARMLPRTRARLDAAVPGRFEADLARFADERGARTHYLRDVPREWLDFAVEGWRRDPAVPAYLPDLAEHELLHFVVAAAVPAHAAPSAEVALDRPMAFTSSMRLARHAWAVHELPADDVSTAAPARRDVRLLAWRDEGHAVRWLELTPLAADVVERLASGEPLGAAVEAACAGHGVSAGAVLPDIARLLADLGARGVLLGARDA